MDKISSVTIIYFIGLFSTELSRLDIIFDRNKVDAEFKVWSDDTQDYITKYRGSLEDTLKYIASDKSSIYTFQTNLGITHTTYYSFYYENDELEAIVSIYKDKKQVYTTFGKVDEAAIKMKDYLINN